MIRAKELFLLGAKDIWNYIQTAISQNNSSIFFELLHNNKYPFNIKGLCRVPFEHKEDKRTIGKKGQGIIKFLFPTLDCLYYHIILDSEDMTWLENKGRDILRIHIVISETGRNGEVVIQKWFMTELGIEDEINIDCYECRLC